ncbi:MAG: hypothetical protein ABR998_11825 [Gemmatimonadales bacterium]|jgi:hypothetical protein
MAIVATALAVALTGMACSKEPTSPNLALSLEELGTLVTELGNVMSPGTSVTLPAPAIRRIAPAWTRLALRNRIGLSLARSLVARSREEAAP